MQKTAYEMRISDWSSDVCSSDLPTWPTLCCGRPYHRPATDIQAILFPWRQSSGGAMAVSGCDIDDAAGLLFGGPLQCLFDLFTDFVLDLLALFRVHVFQILLGQALAAEILRADAVRSEEHTSELQSLLRTSYAV